MFRCIFTRIIYCPFALVTAALDELRPKTLLTVTGATAADFVVGAAVRFRMNEERPLLLRFL